MSNEWRMKQWKNTLGNANLPRKWYDWNQQHEIPQEPWTTGQKPALGQTHIQLFVSGENHGGMSEYKCADGWWPTIDGKIQLHTGYYKIHDHHSHTVRGHHVSGKEDGHSPWLVLEMASMKSQELLQEILTETGRLAHRAVTNARKREKVSTTDSNGNTIHVHRGAVNVECRQGRHRSTRQANELARQLRKLGFTVEIIFVHLYMGVTSWEGTDTRGPCGCHVDPWLCQYIPRHGAEIFIEDGQRAMIEGHALLDSIWIRTNSRVLNLSGYDNLEHRPQDHRASTAPPWRGPKAPPPTLPSHLAQMTPAKPPNQNTGPGIYAMPPSRGPKAPPPTRASYNAQNTPSGQPPSNQAQIDTRGRSPWIEHRCPLGHPHAGKSYFHNELTNETVWTMLPGAYATSTPSSTALPTSSAERRPVAQPQGSDSHIDPCNCWSCFQRDEEHYLNDTDEVSCTVCGRIWEDTPRHKRQRKSLGHSCNLLDPHCTTCQEAFEDSIKHSQSQQEQAAHTLTSSSSDSRGSHSGNPRPSGYTGYHWHQLESRPQPTGTTTTSIQGQLYERRGGLWYPVSSTRTATADATVTWKAAPSKPEDPVITAARAKLRRSTGR